MLVFFTYCSFHVTRVLFYVLYFLEDVFFTCCGKAVVCCSWVRRLVVMLFVESLVYGTLLIVCFCCFMYNDV